MYIVYALVFFFTYLYNFSFQTAKKFSIPEAVKKLAKADKANSVFWKEFLNNKFESQQQFQVRWFAII